MRSKRKANLKDADLLRVALYNNGELALFDDVSDLKMKDAVETEVYLFVLVLEGSASLDINGVPHAVQRNDLFVCPPNVIVESCFPSDNLRCHCIGVSPAYVQKIVPMAENMWDVKILFEKNPVFSLQPWEAAVFCQYYALLSSRTHLPPAAQERIIGALMQAFVYEMQIILSRMIQAVPRPFTSGENLFRRFIGLLEASYPKSREVLYYADRLHVTPKYLSFVCKKSGGQTASRVIDQYVMKDIEYQLKHSSKTLKEISNELDFPNLSFFGKYVKTHFGLPPTRLREHFRRTYEEWSASGSSNS